MPACVFPISIGLAIGPRAWSSSDVARPSQKNADDNVTA
jgi:hypothetical protein